MDTLHTPWSWHNYCLNHRTRTCYSCCIIFRCRFTNWQLANQMWMRRAAEPCIFLASIWLVFASHVHGIALVMAAPAQEMDNADRQWNTEKDVQNVRDFSVKRLPSGGTSRGVQTVAIRIFLRIRSPFLRMRYLLNRLLVSRSIGFCYWILQFCYWKKKFGHPWLAVCLRKHNTLVCVPTESRKSACFEVIHTVIANVTGREQAA